MSKNNDETSNDEIIKRLDAVISILLKDDKSTQLSKIEYLTKLSFSNEEIAKILTTTKSTIEAQKYKKPKVKK